VSTFQIPIELNVTDAVGNGYPLLYVGTAHRHLVPGYLKDVDGSWYVKVRIPQNYVGTPVAKLVIAANATTGVTRLIFSSKSVADTETINVSYTAETAQDITVPGTAYLAKVVSFTITTSGLAAGEDLFVRVQHEGNHANDTLAVDTLLVQAVFQYNDA